MTLDDFIVYAVLLGSIVLFGGAAILALSWAVRDGQFQNFERGAKTIFDPDEPIGEITDCFPDCETSRLPTPPKPMHSANGVDKNHQHH